MENLSPFSGAQHGIPELSMADGAIGYLENDTENRKIFHSVSKALKHGGKYFMDIMNGGYADFEGKPSSDSQIQLLICAEKK